MKDILATIVLANAIGSLELLQGMEKYQNSARYQRIEKLKRLSHELLAYYKDPGFKVTDLAFSWFDMLEQKLDELVAEGITIVEGNALPLNRWSVGQQLYFENQRIQITAVEDQGYAYFEKGMPENVSLKSELAMEEDRYLLKWKEVIEW